MLNNRAVAWSLLLPSAVWLFLFFVLPIAGMVILSLQPDMRGGPPSLGWLPTLVQYQNIFQGDVYLPLLGLSIRSVHCCLDRHPAGIPPGLIPGFSCREKILALTDRAILPFWTSYLLRVIAWKTILGSNGLINNLLIYLGLVDEPVRILLYSRLAVILTLVYVWLPFVALPIYASLQRISPSLLEAAAILEHPRGSHFSGDPAVKPAGCDCRFFHGIDPHRGGIYYPTAGGRHRSTLYGNIIELYFGDGANWPLGSAMSVVMLAGFFFLALIVSRFVDFKRFVE